MKDPTPSSAPGASTPAAKRLSSSAFPEDMDKAAIYYRDFTGGQMARDMTVFVDDDGIAYHIYASEDNGTLQIAELDDTYTRHTGRYARLFEGRFMEAPPLQEGRQILVHRLGLHRLGPQRRALRRRRLLRRQLGADLARFSAAQAGKPDAAAKLRAETLTFSGLPRGLLGTAHDFLTECSGSYGQTEEKYCSVDEDDETADLSRVSADASFSCDRRVSPAFLCFASCAAGCKVRVPFELEIRCGLYYRDLDNDEISPPLNLAKLGVFVMDCGGTWDNDVSSPLTGYPTRMALALTGQNLNGEGGDARTTTLQTHLDIAVPESRTVALWPDLSFLEDWVADNLRGRDFEAETAYGGFVRRELRHYANASFSVSLNGYSAGAAIPVA